MARPTLQPFYAASAGLRLCRPASLRRMCPCRPARRAASSMGKASRSSPLAGSPAQHQQGPMRSSVGFGSLALTGSMVVSTYVLYLYATDTRASYHGWLVPPLLRLVYPDAEEAHHAGTRCLQMLHRLGLNPRERPAGRASVVEPEASDLAVTVFDTTLANPIGISAGLDKEAEIPDALFDLGAAVVEVGGCTPWPQPGNARPRVWRVTGLDGLVNRYGLNSGGADAMAARLRARARRLAGAAPCAVVPPGSLLPGRLLCVQVAKQASTDERDVDAVARDYVYCAARLAPYADVLVVNVSSPNTPGLRDLQMAGPLGTILAAVVQEAARTERSTKPRVMVKVSPDEDEDAQVEGIVRAVHMSGVDGVIVGNTTKRRTGLVPNGVSLTAPEQRALAETGGFSGPTMFDRTLDLVARYRKMLDDHPRLDGQAHGVAGAPAAEDATGGVQKVIFATGGIRTGEQALRVLEAGASVAMVYTGMVYGGAGVITRIKDEMRSALKDGNA